MREVTKASVRVMGLDLGDRWIHYCGLDVQGQEVESGRFATNRASLARAFEGASRWRVILEAGPQTNWIARELEGWGHEVVVANPRKLSQITQSSRKSDRVDAAALARWGWADPRLLHPIVRRSERSARRRDLVHARSVAVGTRTAMVNHVRGVLKKQGVVVPRGTSGAWAQRCREQVPKDREAIVVPLLLLIEALGEAIRVYDQQIEREAAQEPAAVALRQVDGVGPITALTYVATIDDPHRFARSRQVGSYVGLAPRSDRSGDRAKECGITHCGDSTLRWLLVQSAQYILGPHGKDCDLRRYGLALVARGGRAAKRRAVTAVARKLAVMLHRLWASGEPYEPFYREAHAAAA